MWFYIVLLRRVGYFEKIIYLIEDRKQEECLDEGEGQIGKNFE